MRALIAIAVLACVSGALLLTWGETEDAGDRSLAVEMIGGEHRVASSGDVQLIEPTIAGAGLAKEGSESDDVGLEAAGGEPEEERSTWTEFEWRELHLNTNLARFEASGGKKAGHAELLVVSSIATILDYQGRAYPQERQHLAPPADFKETGGFIYGDNVYRFPMYEFPEYVAWRETYQKSMRAYDPDRAPSELTPDVSEAILRRAAEALRIAKTLQGQGR